MPAFRGSYQYVSYDMDDWETHSWVFEAANKDAARKRVSDAMGVFQNNYRHTRTRYLQVVELVEQPEN